MKTFLTARSKTVRILLVSSTISLCLTAAGSADDVQSRIDEYFKSRVASNDLRVEVLLSRKGQPVIRGEYGENGLTRMSNKHTSSSIFPVGAIAEQFVAAAVLRLEEQGKVKPDRSVCAYLSQCPKAWNEVKVVHLLTHTSGLPLPQRSLLPHSGSSSRHSLRSVLANFVPSSMAYKPGTTFRYNELDFTILTVVLGELSGQPPRKYIETELFHPQEMVHTECSGWGSGTSTLEDLYRWNLALASSKIISRSSFDQMLTPYRDGYSLGWKIIKEFDRRLALQNGESEGVSVSIRMYPDDQTFIIVVARGTGAHAGPLSHDVAAIAFGRDYPLSRGF